MLGSSSYSYELSDENFDPINMDNNESEENDSQYLV